MLVDFVAESEVSFLTWWVKPVLDRARETASSAISEGTKAAISSCDIFRLLVMLGEHGGETYIRHHFQMTSDQATEEHKSPPLC